MFITKWLEMGVGTDDDRWQAHTWMGKSDDGSIPVGTIEGAVEGGRRFAFDSLLTRWSEMALFQSSADRSLWAGGAD